jgi:hypothetical protein
MHGFVGRGSFKTSLHMFWKLLKITLQYGMQYFLLLFSDGRDTCKDACFESALGGGAWKGK